MIERDREKGIEFMTLVNDVEENCYDISFHSALFAIQNIRSLDFIIRFLLLIAISI